MRTVGPQSSEINGGDCVWGPQRGGDWAGDGDVRARARPRIEAEDEAGHLQRPGRARGGAEAAAESQAAGLLGTAVNQVSPIKNLLRHYLSTRRRP